MYFISPNVHSGNTSSPLVSGEIFRVCHYLIQEYILNAPTTYLLRPTGAHPSPVPKYAMTFQRHQTSFVLWHDAGRETFCRTIGGNVTRIIVAVDPTAQGIAPNHGNHHGVVPVPAIRVELYRNSICIQLIQIYGNPKMMHVSFRPHCQFAEMEAAPMTSR